MAFPTSIRGPQDLILWEKSEAYTDLMGMITSIASVIKGKTLKTEYTISENAKKISSYLDDLSQAIDNIPPVEQPGRFGNTAYRTWNAEMSAISEKMLLDILPGDSEQVHREELLKYLNGSFGNATRIDYGTGHELAFAAFLCCLFKVKVFTEADFTAVCFDIFNKYLQLCRKFQVTYRLEPAGSQGVWSMDDFQFLPFLWGASQLIGHPSITPLSIPKGNVAEQEHADYLFFASIKHINATKTGPFSEHSSTLYSIKNVPHWEKVYSGCLKMYKAEVLGKLPVVQHFIFSSMLPLKPAPPPMMRRPPPPTAKTDP